MEASSDRIRNFVIISHVDHGKSTLADRFLELTGTVEPRKMRAQYLDQMELEREKGITIKMQPVRMIYRPPALVSRSLRDRGEIDVVHTNDTAFTKRSDSSPSPSAAIDHPYVLNLIDTPGHADFSYEVSRALAAVEGAILLVDATQGVEAQTVANLHLAVAQGLHVIPVINKIDLPSADIWKTESELQELLGVLAEDVFKVSAKTGAGVPELLEAVIERIPPPAQHASKRPAEGVSAGPEPLRALVFDSLYDPYQGVVAHVRIVDGRIRAGEKVLFMATAQAAEAVEVGVFLPERAPRPELAAGDIGYVATGMKEPEKVRVGDTITAVKPEARNQNPEIQEVEPLPGYREPAAVVFASIFPEDQDEFESLRDALQKLRLNDAAFLFEPGGPSAVGRGFRAGFLGMLHLEIVAERLRREYGLRLVFVNPSVAVTVKTKTGGERLIHAAAELPGAQDIVEIREPWATLEVITPPRFFGPVSRLVKECGGSIGERSMLGASRLVLRAEAPLRAIIVDFSDRLKSVSHGFASFVYDVTEWRNADLVRLDIRIAGEPTPALAEIVPRATAYAIGRERVGALKALLPRELFAVPLQAEVEGRIIARETLPALKKDVTGYLYGGDRTRKMKLWQKQKRGKRRLGAAGRVEIPPDVFRQLLRRSAETRIGARGAGAR